MKGLADPQTRSGIRRHGESLVRGRYRLFNNLWGASSGDGSQWLWDRSTNDGCISWETTWDWSGPRDTIKSYAAAVLGWHWGWEIPDTGLPVRLDLADRIPTSWRFELALGPGGKVNVTYDIWLSSRADVGAELPSGEVMIWLSHTDDVTPFGSRLQTIPVAEAEWDLWKGPHPESRWPVYSFVRTVDATGATCDILDFLRCLTTRDLPASTYVVGIEAGVEVFAGSGSLRTLDYSARVGG